MKFHYVEVRRLHSPYVFSAAEIENFRALAIDLRPLHETWESGEIIFSPKCETSRSEHNGLAYGEWRPVFASSARCEVQKVTDPADAYETDDTLCFRFNEAAVKAIGDVISQELASSPVAESDGGANEKEVAAEIKGQLRESRIQSLYMRWLADCQVFDVASVFDIPATDFIAAHFDTFSAALTKPLHQLWPVFISVVDQVWRAHFCNPQRPMPPEVGSWENYRWRFGQPSSFYEAGHPDFDFSCEYDYDALLIVESSDADIKRLLSQLRLTQMKPTTEFPDGKKVFVSKRSVSVLHFPPGAVFFTSKEQPFGPHAHWALGIVFISLILKYDGYNQRLYAAILNEVAAQRFGDNAETLRRLVYRTERLRVRLHERALSLSEYMNEVYKAWASVCDVYEVTSRVDRLTDLIIAAAEGIETKAQQNFERTVEVVGLCFLALTFVTFVTGVWEFANPEHRPDHPVAIRFYIALGTLAVTVLAMVLCFVWWKNRNKLSKSRGLRGRRLRRPRLGD